MGDIPLAIAATVQSRRHLRVSQQRGLNVFDDPFEVLAVTTPMTAVSAATYSKPVNVLGWDRVLLLVDFTDGNIAIGEKLDIQYQVSWDHNANMASAWYDRAGNFDTQQGTPTAVRGNIVSYTLVAVDNGAANRLAFELATLGHYMRFRFGSNGADLGDSSVKVDALRIMK